MLAAKEIDNACKHAEINPHQLQELKKQLIHQPLSKYVNVYFADHVMEQIETAFKQYLDIVQKVPLDGVNAEKAQKLIHCHYVSMAVGFVCHEMFEGMRTTPEQLANSGQTAMQFVFENLQGISAWRQHIDSATKEQKDKYRIWSKGEHSELPDITGIAAVGKAWTVERDWGVIKARLVAARIWDYFFYRSGTCDLDIICSMDVEQQFNSLIEALQRLLREDSEQYQTSAPMALELYERMRLRNPKSHEDEQRCRALLEQLHRFQSECDLRNETTYYYHWMKARYHLHRGESDAALESYKLAYEQSIYRSGENIACIIKEATLVSSRLQKPDKSFINRLRSMAAVFELEILPSLSSDQTKRKPELVEEWEVSAYARYFESYFTKESFFPGADYPEFYGLRYGAWLVDETKYKVNPNNPDKMLSVGEQGLMVKRMPQLVYFAMNGDESAVKALIEAGADVNKVSKSNESALLMAVQAMQVNLLPLNSMNDGMLKVIASKPHKEKTVNLVTTKRKLTALGCAVQTGRFDVVKAVIELGAKVDQRHDTSGKTPLFTCLGLIIHHKRPSIPSMLAESNKYSDQNLQSYMAHAAGLVPHDKEQLKKVIASNEEAPIFSACEDFGREYIERNLRNLTSIDGLREIAKYLIEKGANPNAKHDTAMLGYTPLMLAIELDEAELVEAMLDSKYHQVNWGDTCVDSSTRQRIDLERLIVNWRSKKIDQLLVNRFSKT
ncbi:ankyrin repeat domain-containing protein [Vibrio fortis]|uniref:ankyrin repeat domain-containing protein n=1 Tax=Vibrio fortis TaxID=212667 RepID=UPI0038CD0FAC